MTAQTAEDLPPWDGKVATINEMFLDDENAVEFMRIISRWTHLYDDLIDGDTEIDEDFVHQVMWDLMVRLPMNPFYAKHANSLTPVVVTGILNWRAANEMEKSGCDEELAIAHSIRYSINDIAYMVMVILGGPNHAAQYARDARLAFQRDTFKHYMREHKNV